MTSSSGLGQPYHTTPAVSRNHLDEKGPGIDTARKESFELVEVVQKVTPRATSPITIDSSESWLRSLIPDPCFVAGSALEPTPTLCTTQIPPLLMDHFKCAFEKDITYAVQTDDHDQLSIALTNILLDRENLSLIFDDFLNDESKALSPNKMPPSTIWVYSYDICEDDDITTKSDVTDNSFYSI